MQFVEHDIAQVLEEAPGVVRGDEQSELLGRSEQDVGRYQFLTLALVRRRVSGARLDGEAGAQVLVGNDNGLGLAGFPVVAAGL